MICRLCLNNLNEENTIELFSYNENSVESRLVKMIAKYFQLELAQDDSVSTSICKECWVHLDDFDQFCKLIEQKQSNLRNEFLEVKCITEMVVDELHEEVLLENNEESLLDIKDVFLKCDAQLCESNDGEFGYANNVKEIPDNDLSDDILASASKWKSKTTGRAPRKCKASISERKTKSQNRKKIPKPTTKKVSKKQSRSSKNVKAETDPVEQPKSSTENRTANENETVNDSETTKTKKLKACTPKKYEEHDKLISNNMRLKCELCEAPMESFPKLHNHFRVEHNCKGYIHCCGKRFTKRIMLVDHIRTHLNPNYFQCKVCEKVLKDKTCLTRHMENLHAKDEEKLLKCTMCEKKFAFQRNLDIHTSYHMAKKDFACELCDRAFVTKGMLRGHIRTVHENVSSFVCDFCGQKFKFKPSFERHVREHNGIFEEPVQCNICGEWLKHKNGLRQHLPKHVEINVECEFCGRICHSKSVLKAHIRYTHRMKRNLQCTFCEKTFKSKSNLEEHIATHTGEKRNQCPHCSREFRSKANMYVHIKRDHFEEWKLARSRVPPNTSSSQ